MTQIFHRLYQKLLTSAIFNSWFNNGIRILSSLIAIPIVITKLSVEEINVWLLFMSVLEMSRGVLFGFNATFARFVAYSYAGVPLGDIRYIKDKKNVKYSENNDYSEMSRVFYLMKRVYLIFSVIFFFALYTVGYFVLKKSILALEDPTFGWIGWGIVVLSSSISISLAYFQVFLEGINNVALIQRTKGIVNFIGLFFILMVLFFVPTLVSIVLIYELVVFSTVISIAYYGTKHKRNFELKNLIKKFDIELFKLIWESAWKSGLTTIISNIVKHFSAILVAQLFSPTKSASFLFTKRLFDVLENFTTITFLARIPLFSKYRGRGDFDKLLPILRQTQYLVYGVFLLGYCTLLAFGNMALSLINSNVVLGSVSLIILFSFAGFFTRWAGMSLAISNQANHVVEHIIIPISSIAFFIIIFLLYDTTGIEVFPLAQMLSMMLIIPLIARMVYGTIHTTFWNYEKRVMIPFLGVLFSINLLYYLFN